MEKLQVGICDIRADFGHERDKTVRNFAKNVSVLKNFSKIAPMACIKNLL
jgi:hypothetical protein